MLFDPEDGKTDDEIIEIALRRMKPETRARLEHISQVSGRSIGELTEEALEIFEEYFKDPVHRAAWLAKIDWREQPYGPDPTLRKDRAP